ncbi:MAG: SRPBCC domain-containing protein [Chloroflexi bacterium]|nr:SRPBCC domain-containing protein [Chloroflexota bacterium]
MGMIQETTTVAAPPQRVWEAVVDFEARPRWEPRVKEASILGGGPLQEGSRIRLKVDRDKFTSTVIAMEPPASLVLLVKGPGFRVTHSYELHPEGTSTRLVMAGDYQGIIGRLVGRFMRKSVRRDLSDELAAIKRAVEASS